MTAILRDDPLETEAGSRLPRPTGMIGQYRILVSADGRSCVYSYSRVRGDLMLIDGLR